MGKTCAGFYVCKDNETPYQVQQAKIAIANGSVLVGLGPGKQPPKRNFLPQAYNDFIYSIIIEEYGLAWRGIHDFYLPGFSFPVYHGYSGDVLMHSAHFLHWG
jgi:hypothetical protein